MYDYLRRTFPVICVFSVTVCLLFTAATAMECCPETAPAPAMSPLPPQWRATAYQGMIRQMNPRHPHNVKFLFLGDPVPATLKGTRKQAPQYGYGGLVAVRKKSVLWMVNNSVRFYLLDAGGNLLVFRDIDAMDSDDVSPRFYTVDITVTSTYVPPVPTITYDKNGVPSFGNDPFDMNGGWVTSESKSVTPILDAHNQGRLRAFRQTPVDRLPACQ